MKFINPVLVLVVLCGWVQLSYSENLKCEFSNIDFGYKNTTFYSCVVTSLENISDNIIITNYTGLHNAKKNDQNVNAIHIYKKNTKYIPANLGLLFNLNVLYIQKSQLVEIKAKDFKGMENLELLDLGQNNINYLSPDAFTKLTKLKQIYLYSNQIEELPIALFANNVELEGIHLDMNKIKYIGSGIFNELSILKKVNLVNVICLSKHYEGITEIFQLKQDIKVKCKNPNDAIELKLNEISTEIKTEFIRAKSENQRELNEMMKQLLNDRKELEMLRTELSEAKDKQKKGQEGIIKVKKELSEAKKQQQEERSNYAKNTQTMIEKNSKLERETNGLNKGIMEVKEQRRIERSAFVEVKRKLNKANEQLATDQKIILELNQVIKGYIGKECK